MFALSNFPPTDSIPAHWLYASTCPYYIQRQAQSFFPTIIPHSHFSYTYHNRLPWNKVFPTVFNTSCALCSLTLHSEILFNNKKEKNICIQATTQINLNCIVLKWKRSIWKCFTYCMIPLVTKWKKVKTQRHREDKWLHWMGEEKSLDASIFYVRIILLLWVIEVIRVYVCI